MEFRPVEEADFPLLTRWLAEPQVRRFYQKNPITLGEVAAEYGPAVRGEEPSWCDLAVLDGVPFAYLQSYRNADYPPWAELIGTLDGVSVDLYLGEPAYLHRGLGRAALSDYLTGVVRPRFPTERNAYIAHEKINLAALRCSQAAGFHPLRAFLEDGLETILLAKLLPPCLIVRQNPA
jgi:aminoglycoside 6'-N-acetyltransferase